MSLRSDAISSRRLSETWTSMVLRKVSNASAGPASFVAGRAASSVPPRAASGATERFWPRSASRGGAF